MRAASLRIADAPLAHARGYDFSAPVAPTDLGPSSGGLAEAGMSREPPRMIGFAAQCHPVLGAALAVALIGGCAKREEEPPPPPPPPEQSFESGGQISRWMLCGPWPVSGATALARAALDIDFLSQVGGEADADPVPGGRCPWGRGERSFRQIDGEVEGVDLGLHAAGTEGVIYLATRVRSDAPRRAFFHVEASGPMRAWCNGKEVFTSARGGDEVRFQAFDAMLVSGTNRLLVKIVAGSPPGTVRVRMADEAAHRHALAAAAIRKTDPDILRVVVGQSGEAGELVTARAKFELETLGAFDDLVGNWSITAPGGAVEWEDQVTLRDAAEAKLPPEEGFHRLRLEVSGLRAETLVIERTLVTSKDPAALRERTVARAEALMADPARSAYAGRIAAALEALRRAEPDDASPLELLVGRIGEAEADALRSLRGPVSWSARSMVGGGQDFRMRVPEGYRQDFRHPLHIRFAEDASEPDDAALAAMWSDAFVMWPGRRAMDSLARGIGERDVLGAVKYVTSHWSIDERRIYISGEGWPGAAAWRLAARWPDRFSALRVAGSPGPQAPVENLSRVPVFSTHAEDDAQVPWWLSRVPLRQLSRSGGFAVAHDIVGADEGGARIRQELGTGVHWERAQRSPIPVDRVEFVATDGASAGAYWIEVLEWHDGAEPARVLARCSRDNGLFLDADNAAVLRVDMKRAPLDTQRPVRITVNGRRQGIGDPPFGEGLYLSLSGEFLRVTSQAPSPAKGCHYRPSDPAVSTGARPLIIVRGTRGAPEVKAAIRLAAERLCRMAVPSLGPASRLGDDPIWDVKDDTEVSDEDHVRADLLLLGGPEQNGLVASLAPKLPVACEGDQIVIPDGRELADTARAWWLHHPNPLAPAREIFVVAAKNPAFFTSGMPAAVAVRGRAPLPDFMLWADDGTTLAAAGFFGAGWEWVPPPRSGTLPEGLCSARGWLEFEAGALARAGAADFTVLPRDETEQPAPFFAPGESTWGDALACAASSPIWRFTFAYREIGRLGDRLRTSADDGAGSDIRLHPEIDGMPDGRGRFRVVARDAPLAARLLRLAGPRAQEADFAGEDARAAIRWAIDAAAGNGSR